MPIHEADPWRLQYFTHVRTVADITTEESDAWQWYPAHRWVYDKLAVAHSQGLEAGPHGVTVNCIAPGTIRHRRIGAAAVDGDASHIPIGRAGTPADVAQLVSYLASDAAGYMSGAVITLDGGATAGRSRVSKRR